VNLFSLKGIYVLKMNKIALLGKGKTGSKVLELRPDVIAFNQSMLPNYEKLKDCDVIISFLPGEPFKNYLPLLIDSNKPVICGSTGFQWPNNINQILKEKKITWIKGSNFSLGMALIKKIIKILGKSDSIFSDYSINLHEIHHTQKKDAPSGTALSWKSWLEKDVPITHERIGDEIGTHSLYLTTPYEKISLHHQSLDRKLFAQGALWACDEVLKNDLPCGLLDFQEVVLKRIFL